MVDIQEEPVYQTSDKENDGIGLVSHYLTILLQNKPSNGTISGGEEEKYQKDTW